MAASFRPVVPSSYPGGPTLPTGPITYPPPFPPEAIGAQTFEFHVAKFEKSQISCSIVEFLVKGCLISDISAIFQYFIWKNLFFHVAAPQLLMVCAPMPEASGAPNAGIPRGGGDHLSLTE